MSATAANDRPVSAQLGNCPRCRLPLAATAPGDPPLSCTSCHGAFVPASLVRSGLLEAAVPSKIADVPTIALTCPGCGVPMQEIDFCGTPLDRCHECGGVWLDGGESLADGKQGHPAAQITRYLLYSLSLPERTVRSTIGLAAGAAKEATALLVPQAFQSSKTYEIVIRNSLKFLTEDIGGAAAPAADVTQTPEGYIARKAVGSFVDFASLATLHLSPIWLLAVVSDVAYGSKSYLVELARELQRLGLIAEDSTIHHVDDLLEALQQGSGNAASMLDTPPLSIDQLKESLATTRAAIGSANLTKVMPEAEMRRYWQEMRALAARDNVSLLEISGAMTLHSLNKLKTISHGALTGIRVAGGLFNRHVLAHYVDSLDTIRKKGFYLTVRESHAPYVQAVWNNFAADRSTWTENLLSGKLFASAYRGLRSWLSRGASSEQKK